LCDVTVRPLERIPAGTVIGNDAPTGWTHLLLKSHPRPGAGDVAQVSADHLQLAGLLFTALVAEVRQEGGRHRLARVAVGLGTRVGGKDVIITPQTQQSLGANLGLLARMVLARADEKLAGVVSVARSPSLAVFDAPNLMLRGGRHRPMVLRYAVLLEPTTGRLDTLVWLLDPEEGSSAEAAEWLPPAKVDEGVLHVDGREFTLGFPNERSFALCRLPAGQRRLTFPEPLRALACQPRLSEALAVDLEARLRAVLKDAGRR
jgi:hypothetical protein